MPRRPRSHEPPGPTAAPRGRVSERAAIVFWIGLLALAAARAALALVPTMHFWGINVLRFVDPVLGWTLWGIGAIALVPAIAQRATRLAGAIGNLQPAIATFVWAAAGALIVLSFPDRVRFVGDFLLRQGTVEVQRPPAALFPQALPLDVLLHVTLPVAAVRAGWLDAASFGQALGMLSAAALGAAAAAFPRRLGVTGTASFAASAMVLFGAALAMFTGYSKAFVELCPLTAWAGVLALSVVRERRGILFLGLVVAAALALHRSALALIPVMAACTIVWLRTERGERREPIAAAVIGMLLPWAVLAYLSPKLLLVARSLDLPAHVASNASVPWSMVALDVVNLALLLAPISIAAVLAMPFALRNRSRYRESLVLGLILLPFVVATVAIRPIQGVPRDWDVFAAGGVALALVTAWIAIETLRAAPRREWLGISIAVASIVPSLLFLIHGTDLPRGIGRARAIVTESPVRPERERGTTWEYLGIRSSRLGRAQDAAIAYRNAAELMPSPRILMQWAYAETRAGNLDAAQSAYRRLLDGTPGDLPGWRALIEVALRRGDPIEARRAAHELLRRSPGDPVAREVLRKLEEPEAAGR